MDIERTLRIFETFKSLELEPWRVRDIPGQYTTDGRQVPPKYDVEPASAVSPFYPESFCVYTSCKREYTYGRRLIRSCSSMRPFRNSLVHAEAGRCSKAHAHLLQTFPSRRRHLGKMKAKPPHVPIVDAAVGAVIRNTRGPAFHGTRERAAGSSRTRSSMYSARLVIAKTRASTCRGSERRAVSRIN